MNHKLLPKCVLLVAMAFLFASCMSTYTDVGSYDGGEGSFEYSRGKQCYLFWGLLPLGRGGAETPQSGVCRVSTHQTFGDCAVTALTLGIFSMQTVEVSPRCSPSAPRNPKCQLPTSRKIISRLGTMRANLMIRSKGKYIQ